jgi:hypothetical protein
MDENERLAQRFEEHQPHLRAVADRMLGSLTEADDAVQDTWLRRSRSGAFEEIAPMVGPSPPCCGSTRAPGAPRPPWRSAAQPP